MASTSPPRNVKKLLAVAIVVDSGLTPPSEWDYIVHNYFPHLLAGLAEGDASCPVFLCPLRSLRIYSHTLIIQELRLGFVAYEHRGDRTSVFKRFFSVDAHNELKENRAIPFMGHTSTGGSEGMAALHGHAAAIEVKVYFVL